jgi:pimeloyl-ACP methyl ester carboxylesterase
LFGLSMRQAALAQAIANGATRDAAATAVGASTTSAKADMKVVFQACGVANAVDLARIAAEVDALAGLAKACNVEIEPHGEATAAEPLRLVARRRQAGQIAVTDHGPAKARPLLMFHAAVGGRHQCRRLVAALQADGWRPISFDRPGFGLTDMIDGPCPFAEAGQDALDIIDALEIDRVTLFGRTASAATLATVAAMPGRIAGGILVAPDPPMHLDRRHSGMMGRGKALFFGNRTLATAFANILSRRTSSAQIARMQRESVAGSAIDEAMIDDPEVLADIVRASRQAALGMQGFLAEMQAHGRGTLAPGIDDGRNWLIMAGARDPLYDFADSEAFWRETLPGVRIDLVADGGRWLHLTHVDRVVAALRRTLQAGT